MTNYYKQIHRFVFHTVCCLIFLSTIIFLYAGENSQWRGPDRSGIYPESGLLKSWPDGGPPILLEISGLGDGYSSPAVTDDLIIVTGMKEKRGFSFAFTKDGKPAWTTEYGEEWYRSYEGARTTPTVVGDLTYLSGALGDVTCLKTATGEIVWQKNTSSEYSAKSLRWGLTESLLVHGDLVYSTPGGKNNMVAFNRFSGQQVWVMQESEEASAYCSPVIVTTGEAEIIVTMTGRSIIGVDPINGKLLWKHPHITDYDINPNTPYYKEGKLYCVSGYGTGGVQLSLSPDGKAIKEIWRDEKMDVQMDGFIVHNGAIFGTSHKIPAWHCINWNSGQEMWVEPGIGKSNVIMADGLIYGYSQDGEVALIVPTTEGYKELSSFQIKKGSNQHWAHPVINSGVLYVRHGDILLAFNINE